MKKILFMVLGLSFLVFISSNIVFGQEEDDWIESLGLFDEVSFGYTSDQKIIVEDINDNEIKIKSPIIEGELGEKIQNYNIMYSTYSISEVLENSNLLDKYKEKEVVVDTDNSSFTVVLQVDEDDIDKNEIYYVSLIPKDEFGIPGDLSNDICFQVEKKITGVGNECQEQLENTGGSNNDEVTETHSSAGADMNLANISHNVDKNKVILRWTAINGSDKIEIFLWDPNDERFNRLTKVDMSDERYEFTTNRNGDHSVKFIPFDGNDKNGIEKIYTFNVSTVDTQPESSQPQPTTSKPKTTTGIVKVPDTGPKENIIAILILSVVGYLVYKKLKAKA